MTEERGRQYDVPGECFFYDLLSRNEAMDVYSMHELNINISININTFICGSPSLWEEASTG